MTAYRKEAATATTRTRRLPGGDAGTVSWMISVMSRSHK